MAAGWQCSRQTNRGSGHCIQDKQGRRQVDWVLVGVGDLLRFPLVAEDRRMRGGWSRRGEEGAKILYCRCLSHFHPPLSHTLSLTISVPVVTQTHSLFPYTYIFTHYKGVFSHTHFSRHSHIQRSCSLYFGVSATPHINTLDLDRVHCIASKRRPII